MCASDTRYHWPKIILAKQVVNISPSDADLAFRDDVREFLAHAWDQEQEFQAMYSFGEGGYQKKRL